MLAPAGVDQAKDTVIPAVKQTIERTAAHTTTFRKLLNTRIAERAGKAFTYQITEKGVEYLVNFLKF